MSRKQRLEAQQQRPPSDGLVAHEDDESSSSDTGHIKVVHEQRGQPEDEPLATTRRRIKPRRIVKRRNMSLLP